MPNSQLIPKGTSPAPSDFVVASAQELQLRVISATFNGAGAGAAFLPAITLISSNGAEIGTFPVDTSVAAGASADVTWFPGLTRNAQGAAASGIVGACVQLTADKSTGAGSVTYDIPWDAIVYDTSGGAMWNIGAPTILTAPTTGLYIVTMSLDVLGNANQYCLASFDTTGQPLGSALGWGTLPAAAEFFLPVVHVTQMQAGDTVIGEVDIGAGAAVTVRHGTGAGSFMTLTRLA